MHILMVKHGRIELPLYVSVNTASTADGEMAAYDLADLSLTLRNQLPDAHISHFIADTGYDAIELYKMLIDHGISPVISLHPNSVRVIEANGITYDKDGRPLCAGKLPMRHNDYNKATGAHAFHCPIKRPTHLNGKYQVLVHLEECPLGVLCDTTKMGPFVRVLSKNDPRMHPPLPRNSPKFTEIFKERTATERFFGRVKEKGGLGKRPYRLQHMHAVMGTLHAVLIHRRAHLTHDFGDVADPNNRERAIAALLARPAEDQADHQEDRTAAL
jgi:hypothetical protein